MRAKPELLTIPARDLRAGDLVLLDDGDHYVRFSFPDFTGHVRVDWRDGRMSTWLADEPCQVVRR